MRVEEEVRMSEMLHEHQIRHGCIPSKQDSDPFWQYCQTLFATRFSVRQLKRKLFSFYQQQAEIMESFKHDTGADHTANSEGQNVFTSSPSANEDEHDIEDATVLQKSALMSEEKHPNNVVMGLDSDAEQEIFPSLVRPHTDSEKEFNVGVDKASPLTEAGKVSNKFAGDAACPLNLLQTPAEGATISVNNGSSKSAPEASNPLPDSALSMECNNLPVAAKHLGHDEEIKMLIFIEGTNPPITCHAKTAQDPPSKNPCMEVCKQGGSDFQSISSSLADISQENAQTYGDGSGLTVQDMTLVHNVVAHGNGNKLSLQNKADAKVPYSLACSDESVSPLQHANQKLRRKRRADNCLLEFMHEIKTLRKSAMMDLAQAMVILSQCSLRPQ